MLIILLVCSQNQLLLISLNIIFHYKKPGLLREVADSGVVAWKEVSPDGREGKCSKKGGGTQDPA